VPAGSDGVDVEGTENRLFDVIWDGHVVLYGVKTTKDEVENANLRHDKKRPKMSQ
jgi:hypothetical protein